MQSLCSCQRFRCDHPGFRLQTDAFQALRDMIKMQRRHRFPAAPLHANSGKQSNRSLLTTSRSSLDRLRPSGGPAQVHAQIIRKIGDRLLVRSSEAGNGCQKKFAAQFIHAGISITEIVERTIGNGAFSGCRSASKAQPSLPSSTILAQRMALRSRPAVSIDAMRS